MDNIIKAEDYQGTSIYDTLVSDGKNEQIIRETIANNLRKGLITQEQFDKANAQLDDLIKASKKTGAGSRGGHVIGYTKSGKPVYDTKHAGREVYKEFTPEEHEDAAMIHRKRSEEHGEKASRGYSQYARTHHGGMREWHDDTAKSHEHHADKKRKASASPGEKKILADQKKKQIEHHQSMHDFHDHIVSAINQLPHPGLEGETAKHMMEEFNRHKQARDHHKSEKERLEKE